MGSTKATEQRFTLKPKKMKTSFVGTPGRFRSRRSAHIGTRDNVRSVASSPHQAPVRWLVAAAQRNALGMAFAISLSQPRRDGSVMLTRFDLSAWENIPAKIRPALVRLQAAGMLRFTDTGDAFRIRPNYLAVPRA